MAESAWEAAPTKPRPVLKEASREAVEELAVETVAKDEWKAWALLVSAAINFLILAEVEDDGPLALGPLSLDRLLAVMMKDAMVLLCYDLFPMQ